MDREKIAERYMEAYERGDVAGLLRLMHPQGSYYDAFWGETCSGRDLAKYYRGVFEQDACWYKSDDELVTTPTRFVIRYVAYNKSDIEGLAPIFNGAEVMTMSEGLILTISNFYCDPNPVDISVTDCSSNQPDDGLGDGHTTDDCLITNGGRGVCVRSERLGDDPAGRTYTVIVAATDQCGNAAVTEGQIYVPHDQSPKTECVRPNRR